MKISGELNAACVTVTTERFLEHRHVNDIKESGINMFRIIVVTAFRGLEECYNGLENGYLGTQLLRSIYFGPSRFYCVETICAPCGTVIAWAKFARAESPTNILQFLETVYPTEESRPDYICIDKACAVLRTAIVDGSWDTIWKKTTRFIVDTYHYVNHCTTDYLCRKWCNPAPQDGSAPNLVIVDTDNNGRSYKKWAFNTQVQFLMIFSNITY